jgi:hypothetical protein
MNYFVEYCLSQKEESDEIIWISNEGPIALKDMTNGHIKNCLNFLETRVVKTNTERYWIARFNIELLRRGSNSDLESTLYSVIEKEEARLRKLQASVKASKVMIKYLKNLRR